MSEFLFEHGESGLPERPAPAAPKRPPSLAVPGGLLLFLVVAVAGGVLTWKRLGAAREAAEPVAQAPVLPAVIQPTDRVYPPPPSIAAPPVGSQSVSIESRDGIT